MHINIHLAFGRDFGIRIKQLVALFNHVHEVQVCAVKGLTQLAPRILQYLIELLSTFAIIDQAFLNLLGLEPSFALSPVNPEHIVLDVDCLEELGSFYGALPAHAGMWRAAEDTAEDFMGRLAVVPMVLEARGLDVTPSMIKVFQNAKAKSAVAALETIYAEEVSHVAYGSKWFNFMCGRENEDPKEVFHKLVRTYFHGTLKPPFNEEKRADAGIPPDFYWPLTEDLPDPQGE